MLKGKSGLVPHRYGCFYVALSRTQDFEVCDIKVH